MSKLLKFEDFDSNRPEKPVAAVPDITPKVNSVRVAAPVSLEESAKVLVWKGVMESTFFTEAEKTSIFHAMKKAGLSNKLLNENVLSKMREALPSLRADGKSVSEETIDKLEKVMKSAGAFSKYMSDLSMRAWDRILEFYKKKLDGSKNDVFIRMKSMRKDGHDVTGNLPKELANLKEVSMFWLKEFPALLSKAILQSYSKEIMKECIEVSADMHVSLMSFTPNINEDDSKLWSFMGQISDHLKNTEPFDKIAQAAKLKGTSPEKFAGEFIKYTESAGGPDAFDYKMFPVVMEEVCKYRNSSLPKDIREQILKSEGVLRFLPMSDEMIVIIEAVAMTVVSMEAMLKLRDASESVYKK